jgi:broad specificity phosphatase PhoE
LYGHTDIAPQSDLNKNLLSALVKKHQYNAYNLVISSPLQRCRLLAEQVSIECQIPLTIVSDLKEMSFGDFDGVPFDEINQKNKQDWQLLEKFWEKPSEHTLRNGDSLVKFHHRVTTAWLTLLEKKFSCQQEGDKPYKVLLVAHGGVIRTILSHVLQLDWQNVALQQHLSLDNASCSHITVSWPFNDKNKSHSVINSIGMPMLSSLYQLDKL